MACLVTGVGDETGGILDNLLLTDHAHLGLGSIAVGEFEVLDLGHRVHGVHQRHVPSLGGEPSDLAGEPVVRVDEIEPSGGASCLCAKQAGAEGAHLRGQVFLRQFLERTRAQMGDANAGLDLDCVRQRRCLGSGEDLHVDTRGSEAARRLEDVDVESARVTGARLVEGRGVQGHYGNPAGPGVAQKSIHSHLPRTERHISVAYSPARGIPALRGGSNQWPASRVTPA